MQKGVANEDLECAWTCLEVKVVFIFLTRFSFQTMQFQITFTC